MIKSILLVGTGGFCGAISRYLMTELLVCIIPTSYFYLRVFVINSLGCLLMGFFSELLKSSQIINANFQYLVLIGFLGSFTTFSSLINDSHHILIQLGTIKLFLNIILQILIGYLCLVLGISIAIYLK